MKKQREFNKIVRRMRSVGHLGVSAVMIMLMTPVALGNIVGSDTQNFNSATSSIDYVTVQSAKTLGEGRFSLGLFVNHSNNVLPYFENDANKYGNDSSQRYDDSLTSASVVASYGLTSIWDLGIEIPSVIYQHVENQDYHGQFRKRGNTGVRLTTKVRLLEMGRFNLATSGSVFVDRTKNNPYVESSSKSIFAVELMPEYDFGLVQVALNIGYRWRQLGNDSNQSTDEIPVEPTENQTIASIGASLPLTSETSLMWETYSAGTQGDFADNSPRDKTIAESLVGVRHYLTPDLVGHMGVGREMQHSVASSDLRVYAGVHWNQAPEKKKKKIVKKVKEIERPKHIEVLADVLFDYDSAVINKEAAKRELQKIANVINGPGGLSRMVIEGHTCSLGTDEYNLKLSQKRAAAVKEYLAVNFGVPRHKMAARGLGEKHPVASNDSEKTRRKNRRVEFKIYHRNISH